LGWVEYTKKKVVFQERSTTRYDSALLILLSANRARRRTLMITLEILYKGMDLWTHNFRKKEILPFYTEGDRKLVRKPVEQVYGKEDY
jgi:hypothetical protein